MNADVVIVGAGPAGLMLACELSLGGVRPTLLERRVEVGGPPKANGLVGQIMDLLDCRGLLDRIVAESRFSGALPTFPFGSIDLDLTGLGDGPLTGCLIPQAALERVLTERARELGVEVSRGHEVVGLVPDADGVDLQVRGPDGAVSPLRARYVVGCDGVHSRVRDHAGIAFPGTTGEGAMKLARVVLSASVAVPGSWGELEVPGVGRLRSGVNRRTRGGVTVASLQEGVHIVGVTVKGERAGDPRAPLTLEEFQASVREVLGAELPVERVVWLSRIVHQARQAERYRAGRVLLAGDAAHVFPAGGSGLNVGLLDTVNLGWKLAADVLGWGPDGLLDTYEAERHPVGARTLMHTTAQAAMAASNEDGAALRALVGELLGDEPALRRIAAMLQCSDVRYPMPGAHALLGAFAPDLPLTPGPRLAPLLHGARPVLLDLADDPTLRAAAQPWSPHLSIVTATTPDPPAPAMLVRPDAHIAWIAEPAAPPLPTALSTWLGPPS